MEFAEEDVEYFRYFRVALAIAIIRQKPENLPAKQYTMDLAALLQEKQQGCHQKVYQLQTELFLTKQALVQTCLSSTIDEDLTAEMTNSLSSPLPSSKESQRDQQDCCNLLKHAHFLKSVSFMCNKSHDVMSVFAADDIAVVKETLIQIIKVLSQDPASDILALPHNVLQLCADGIIDILECPSLKNYQSELKVPALILVEHLIQMLMEDSVNTLQDKISRVIVVLGCTPTLIYETLTKLVTSVTNVSMKLRDIGQGGCSLRSLVSTYHSIYHVLWTIEAISISSRSGIVQSDFTKIMERSLLHISTSFPVYTGYVWRIQAALVNCRFQSILVRIIRKSLERTNHIRVVNMSY